MEDRYRAGPTMASIRSLRDKAAQQSDGTTDLCPYRERHYQEADDGVYCTGSHPTCRAALLALHRKYQATEREQKILQRMEEEERRKIAKEQEHARFTRLKDTQVAQQVRDRIPNIESNITHLKRVYANAAERGQELAAFALSEDVTDMFAAGDEAYVHFVRDTPLALYIRRESERVYLPYSTGPKDEELMNKFQRLLATEHEQRAVLARQQAMLRSIEEAVAALGQ